MQGDERESLLHVNDPVFGYRDLFDGRWEAESRRHHFAGVLETAQLFEKADRLLRGPTDGERIRREPPAQFDLEETTPFPEGRHLLATTCLFVAGPVASIIQNLERWTSYAYLWESKGDILIS